jgi:dipeptidyl aminopeptidase/acylaminoacyl peptidase
MLDLERLLRVPHVDGDNDFDLSPDGTRVAFAWNRSGTWEIYELRLDGADPPRMISRGPGGKFAPKYSPDGRRLLYALDLDGSENYHPVICDLALGEQTDLTPDLAYAHQPNFAWSPDGRTIAALSNARGGFALYVLPARGGEATLVHDAGHPFWDVRWSPDGRHIAVEAEWHASDRAVLIVSFPEGGARLLGDGINARHPAWSPDGRWLAFSSDAPGERLNLGLFDLADDSIEWLDAAEEDREFPCWSPDGKTLAYLASRGAGTQLGVQALGKPGKKYQIAAGTHARPHYTADGRSLIVAYDDPRRPADLWRLDLRDGSFHQLTDSLPRDLHDAPFVIPEEIWYPDGAGGSIPALLYRPSGAGKASPAVVNIHGGPNWAFRKTWYPSMAHMASRGWVVLAPNYRGSTGYGRSWQAASRFRMGQIDTDDCAAGARYLIREGLADPRRIAVSGRSHGGYLTMTCLTDHPGLWAGGSAVVPFLNWFTCHENSRDDLQHWDLENMGDPVTHRERWQRASPFFRLDQVRAPVQFICGGNDPRCPPGESTAARDRLRALGREVDFHLYAGEGHAFLQLENIVDSELKRAAFLARVLDN